MSSEDLMKTWQQVAPVHSQRCYVSITVVDNFIYAMGGFDGYIQLNTAERYDPDTNQWTLITPKHERRSDAKATTLNGKAQPRPQARKPSPSKQLWDKEEALRLLLMGLLCSFQNCCICGQSGATIPCWARHCNLSFHLPCAKQGGCVTQFVAPYRAFCPAHSPQQAVEATPEPGTQCLICLEPVEDRNTFNTLVCPACRTAWFHRDCIQGQALHAALLSLQCLHCRNDDTFLRDMITMGIRIPFRAPSWESNTAFAELEERHRRCDASECLCPGGRQEAEEQGPWELLLCSSCAAEGTHRHCSGLRDSIAS
ncbi:G2/M phase-specific E3 ubiquitin-protein ligase-like [Chiroxiphia lanceolata]|uniref:G2/M phase-specific E3 ubiquitin-protein ligase-like n=1 Tax=Chiroxiphia lanceolata TaxID=296741 RepID=UPI0013CF0D87|nr:G2/M phase-specific E3 ubiquitin-protein ligase-like [Chiroxiphia lanceolata]